jgi:hypothetical protein
MKLIAIITKHGKEKIIGPILQEKLNMPYQHIYFNTDKFGTFTSEKKRINIHSALKQKIDAAKHLTDSEIIISSEGSFYPHPFVPGLHLNTEHLAFYNRKTNQELIVYENFTELIFDKQLITTELELNSFLEKNKFPSHGVIIEIPRLLIKNKFIKDISKKSELISILNDHKKYILHTDQRADKNPTRSKNIQKLTYKLVEKLQI